MCQSIPSTPIPEPSLDFTTTPIPHCNHPTTRPSKVHEDTSSSDIYTDLSHESSNHCDKKTVRESRSHDTVIPGNHVVRHFNLSRDNYVINGEDATENSCDNVDLSGAILSSEKNSFKNDSSGIF